jgi:hypothetical protein
MLELFVNNNLEGSGRSQTQATIPISAWSDSEELRKQTEQPMYGLEFQ